MLASAFISLAIAVVTSLIAFITFPTKGDNAFITSKTAPTNSPVIAATAAATPPTAPFIAFIISKNSCVIPVLLRKDVISPIAFSIKSNVPSYMPANIPIN